MKRTLRVFSILALVAILFASCENNAEAPTAKNYLFGNSIVSTVKVTEEATDAEGNPMEEALQPEGYDYVFVNYSFDENGAISINEDGYEISDFKGTLDGMSYKVSFTTEMDLAVVLDDPNESVYVQENELTFTVLDESTVKIAGVVKLEDDGKIYITRFDGTAPIFYAAPKWVVENDYFAHSEESPMILSLTKKSSIDLFTIATKFSYFEMVPVEASLSSKSSDDSYEMSIQKARRYDDDMVDKKTTSYLIKKNADGEIELVGKSIHRDETEDGLRYEERMQIIPITNIKLVKAVPEWAEDIAVLVDKENVDSVLPVSSNALSLYYGSNILAFDRAEENGSLKYTVKFESNGEVLYDEYVIEKSETEGEYNYTCTLYQLEEGVLKSVYDETGVAVSATEKKFLIPSIPT